MFLGLALCYGLAFFGVAAEWFWARWFAMGVGNFGSLMLLVLFKVGFEPLFVVFGVSHLLVVLATDGRGHGRQVRVLGEDRRSAGTSRRTRWR